MEDFQLVYAPNTCIYLEKNDSDIFILYRHVYEPRHDKINKMSMRPAKTEISLDIHQSDPPSLIRVFAFAQWVVNDPRFLHADSEHSDQSGRMPRLI